MRYHSYPLLAIISTPVVQLTAATAAAADDDDDDAAVDAVVSSLSLSAVGSKRSTNI